MLRIAVTLFTVLGLAAVFTVVDGALELNNRIDRCVDDTSPAFIIDDAEREAACYAPEGAH